MGLVGIIGAGGNAPLGIDLYRAMYSKEASVPKPKQMAGHNPVGL